MMVFMLTKIGFDFDKYNSPALFYCKFCKGQAFRCLMEAAMQFPVRKDSLCKRMVHNAIRLTKPSSPAGKRRMTCAAAPPISGCTLLDKICFIFPCKDGTVGRLSKQLAGDEGLITCYWLSFNSLQGLLFRIEKSVEGAKAPEDWAFLLPVR
jgi:hypothetical protein